MSVFRVVWGQIFFGGGVIGVRKAVVRFRRQIFMCWRMVAGARRDIFRWRRKVIRARGRVLHW